MGAVANIYDYSVILCENNYLFMQREVYVRLVMIKLCWPRPHCELLPQRASRIAYKRDSSPCDHAPWLLLRVNKSISCVWHFTGRGQKCLILKHLRNILFQTHLLFTCTANTYCFSLNWGLSQNFFTLKMPETKKHAHENRRTLEDNLAILQNKTKYVQSTFKNIKYIECYIMTIESRFDF